MSEQNEIDLATIPKFKVDKNRENRQLLAFNKWKQNKANGVLEWTTGAGKTYIAILAIKSLNLNKPDWTINVIVPTTKLKEDWVGNKNKTGHIQIHNLKNVKVWVINSFVNSIKKGDNTDCDFLIIDEVHRIGATSFSLALEKTKRKFFMGLTATLTRLDGKHYTILKHGGIVDSLSDVEARRLGFISNYLIFNLGIELSEKSKELYTYYDTKFKQKFAYFQNDFNMALGCACKNSPRYINNKWEHSLAALLAIQNGYKCEDLNTIVARFNKNKQIKEHNKTVKTRKDKLKAIPLYQSDVDNFYHPDKVRINSLMWMHYMNMRKNFVYKLKEKLKYLEEIVNTFPDKQVITFSEDAEFADEIVKLLGTNKCRAYHTKMKAKEKNENIDLFENNKIKVLSSVKALTEGFDVKNIEITINLSQTRSKIAATQKRGRANRIDYNNPNKIAIHINIFIDDFLLPNGNLITSNEKKVISDNQKGQSAIFVKSVTEILDIVNEKLGINDNEESIIK